MYQVTEDIYYTNFISSRNITKGSQYNYEKVLTKFANSSNATLEKIITDCKNQQDKVIEKIINHDAEKIGNKYVGFAANLMEGESND